MTSEWQKKQSVVVVEAKSLALVSTKDQNRFCFSSWNQKILPPPNSQMKEETKEKESPPQKKTEHLSGH